MSKAIPRNDANQPPQGTNKSKWHSPKLSKLPIQNTHGADASKLFEDEGGIATS